MTIDPRSRRLKALNNRNADRVLVSPARNVQDLDLPEEGTVAAHIIRGMVDGISSAELQVGTGWSRSTVLVNLYKVAKKTGIGIARRDEVFYLIMPEGAQEMTRPARVINPEEEMPCSMQQPASEMVITL